MCFVFLFSEYKFYFTSLRWTNCCAISRKEDIFFLWNVLSLFETLNHNFIKESCVNFTLWHFTAFLKIKKQWNLCKQKSYVYFKGFLWKTLLLSVIYIWKILFYYVTLDYVSSSIIGGMWRTVMDHASRVFIPSFPMILSVSKYATDWCHRSLRESRLGLIHLIVYIEKCFSKYIFFVFDPIFVMPQGIHPTPECCLIIIMTKYPMLKILIKGYLQQEKLT